MFNNSAHSIIKYKIMKKILIGIDDDFIRKIYSEKLSEAGYKVFTSEKEEEILKIYKEEALDLILLDLSLEGVEGFTIFEKLKKIKEVPACIFSVAERDDAREKALKLGAKDFLVSSLMTLNELVLKIRIILGEVQYYQFAIDTKANDLKEWAKQLGFSPLSFNCQCCAVPLQLLLVKDKEQQANLFKVVLICPKCRDIYFEK